MRIPIHNVCRAFPELDRFSDDQCHRFLEATLKQHWIARQGMRIVMLLCFNIGWYGLTYSTMRILNAISVPLALNTQDPIAIICIIVGALGGGLVGLRLRDRWLRARLAARISQLACPSCSYSFLGLPAIDGTITCPECGMPHNLADRNIPVDTTLITP